VSFLLLQLLDEDQSHQVLFPEAIVVVDGLVKVSLFVDVAEVVA
jgi:hypothetical protein